MRRGNKTGFTLLEFSVVAVMLSILAAVLLERLAYYQGVAEKINMEATVSALRSALRLKVAEYMMAGQKIEYEQLARENPMDWLEIRPPNYAGAFSGSLPDAYPRGSWYFDRSARMLVYLVDHGQNFVPDSLDLKQVRFRLVLSYAETQGGEVSGVFPGPALGIRLETVESYRWFML